jgi:hypothetical protein
LGEYVRGLAPTSAGVEGLRIGIERLSTESYEANVGRPFLGAWVIMLEG